MPSEGKGHTFESCRVRQFPNKNNRPEFRIDLYSDQSLRAGQLKGVGFDAEGVRNRIEIAR